MEDFSGFNEVCFYWSQAKDHMRNKWFLPEFCSTILVIWKDHTGIDNIMEGYIPEEEIEQGWYSGILIMSKVFSIMEKLWWYDNRNEWF